MSLPITGGCQCGAVRYELWDAPEAVYVCHCTQCRKQSGSAFGVSVICRAASLRQLGGKTVVWCRPADSGALVECHFCSVCGARLWHISSRFSGFRSVKGGSLDDPPDLSSAVHLHTAEKVRGVQIPDHVLSFPGEAD